REEGLGPDGSVEEGKAVAIVKSVDVHADVVQERQLLPVALPLCQGPGEGLPRLERGQAGLAALPVEKPWRAGVEGAVGRRIRQGEAGAAGGPILALGDDAWPGRARPGQGIVRNEVDGHRGTSRTVKTRDGSALRRAARLRPIHGWTAARGRRPRTEWCSRPA